jgi:hypothetical protein
MQVTDLIQNDVIPMHHSFEELTFLRVKFSMALQAKARDHLTK